MKEKKAQLAVLIGNAIFGFSFLFSKLALQLTIPSVLIAVRFTTAFLVLNLVVLAGRNINDKNGKPLISFSLKGKPVAPMLKLIIFQPIIYFIAENYGIVYTSSAFAGIIIAVIPLVGIILDVVIMHSKITMKQVICALCSIAGVAITTIGAKDMTSSFKGIVFLLIAVLAGALFYVFSQQASAYYSALERTYVMFAAGSIVYAIVAAVQCFGAYNSLILHAFTQPVFWLSILYLAVCSSVIAFLLLNYGSSTVSVSKATLFANFTTVISIFAGIIILKEPFTWPQLVGAVIILASVYVAR